MKEQKTSSITANQPHRFILLSLLVWLAFLIAACTAPLNETDLQNGTTPEGLVKVRIAVSSDQTSRSLSAGQVQSYAEWKEAIFRVHGSDPAVYYSGAAPANDTLYVEVQPGKNYDILVLAGTKDSHVLLGSDYVDDWPITATGDNTISITLKKITIDPYQHFMFTYTPFASSGLAPIQDDKNHASIEMLKSGATGASDLEVEVKVGNIKPLIDAVTAANFKLANNTLTLFPTDIRNYSFDAVEKKSDPEGSNIKAAVHDLDESFDIAATFTAFKTALDALKDKLDTSTFTGLSGGDATALSNSKNAINDGISDGITYTGQEADTAFANIGTAKSAINALVSPVDAAITAAAAATASANLVAPSGSVRAGAITASNSAFSALKTEVEDAFAYVDIAFNRPNIKGHANFNTAKTTYLAAKSAYALAKTAYDKTAQALANFDNAYGYVEDPTVNTVVDSTQTLTVEYTIPKESMPNKDVTGKLYFDMEYYAFSDAATKKKWHIRNGLDFEPDEPYSGHGAILVKFGDGNPLPGVGVPIP